MGRKESFNIRQFLSRIIRTDIFTGVIGFIIFLGVYSVAGAIEEQYEKTLLLPFLFIHTIIRLVAENQLKIVFSVLIYVIIKNVLLFKDFKSEFLKIFRIGYIILCFMIITGPTIRMNTSYKLDNHSLATFHILFYQGMDMIGNDFVTFNDEPCRMEHDVVTYYTIGNRRRRVIKEKKETYDYLCLDNQRDMIPIPSGYYWKIESLLEESGGVCDITCYKYTHLIKSINGVELKDLR